MDLCQIEKGTRNMPWINQDLCTGCNLCVDDCPVGAIALKQDQKAFINDDECIRCGRCHDICTQEAVRHDGERIPQEVEANIKKTRYLLRHYDRSDEQQAFLERMVRHYKKEQKVAGLTIDELSAIKVHLDGNRS